ncbi:hypothetical protein B0I35DRAFT_418293 [Stachybotrys elegans]|uniref:Uncharacterized protein n=1 Tax=Stachybotrys elegans TaxID=80388 RepID=A0A8K0T2N9_9HYPO|nr:hypothetical protein B0I35DRAFT_418293 [Stachybotrys elegans]
MSYDGHQAACAENIALLGLLDKVPAAPRRNDSVADVGVTQGRALPLSVERGLTSMLAFLSGIEKDSEHVTAVCVEERGSSLRVLIAANAKDTAASPWAGLEIIKNGYDEILGLLKGLDEKPAEEVERSVYTAILTLCCRRILQRARLEEAPGRKNRPSVQGHLHQACLELEHLPGRDAQAFFQPARSLIARLDSCARRIDTRGSIGVEEVALLVDDFVAVSEVPDLEALLLDEGNRILLKIDMSYRVGLLAIIQKTSRYKTAATSIVDIAKKYTALRTASTFIVSVDAQSMGPRAQRQTCANASFEAVLRRSCLAHGVACDVVALCRRLGLTAAQAGDEFKALLRTAAEAYKVHAEVQLMWYIDVHAAAAAGRPRVIAASKDACYLCDAIISLHGCLTTPRSHGKVYVGWRLPLAGLRVTYKEFSLETQRLVAHRVRDTLQSQGSRLGPPAESTIFSIMDTMSSTATSLARSRSVDSDQTIKATTGAQEVEAQPHGHTLSSSDSGISGQPVQGGASNAADQVDRGDAGWRSIHQGKTRLIHVSESLRVFVEYTRAQDAPPKQLSIRLLADRREEAQGDEELLVAGAGGEVHNVDSTASSPREITCGLEEGSVYFRVGREIVKTEFR